MNSPHLGTIMDASPVKGHQEIQVKQWLVTRVFLSNITLELLVNSSVGISAKCADTTRTSRGICAPQGCTEVFM